MLYTSYSRDLPGYGDLWAEDPPYDPDEDVAETTDPAVLQGMLDAIFLAEDPEALYHVSPVLALRQERRSQERQRRIEARIRELTQEA